MKTDNGMVAPQRYKATAPSDAACAKAWDQIMAIAEKHALIVQAFGGVATLAVPEEQRKSEGCRANVLQMCMMNETPEAA